MLAAVLVASLTPPTSAGAQPSRVGADRPIEDGDLSPEDLERLRVEQAGPDPEERVAVDADGDVFVPAGADDGTPVGEPGPDSSESDRPGLSPVAVDVPVGGRGGRIAAAGSPVVVEPAGGLPESALLRLQVLGSELAAQVSPLGAAVAVDLVDEKGERIDAGTSLDLAFSLADVEVPVAASGWERLVWCGGRIVMSVGALWTARVVRCSTRRLIGAGACCGRRSIRTSWRRRRRPMSKS
ncbi:MAG: hypothetical protein ACE367_19085 [Acidimicrobiales bacterium]